MDKQILNKFNGDRLKNARQYKGYTVEELAELIGVSKQTVSQYENHKITPEFDKIISISNNLLFPVQYFMQSNDLKISIGTTFFRSLMKTSKKYRIEQITKMKHLSAIYTFLQEYVEFPIINLPTQKDYSNPEDAAKQLRNFWGLGEGPLTDLIRILEKNGLLVTTFPTSTDDIDAFSQLVYNDGKEFYLIALSNNKDTAARTHFDVAHELGHILLHEWSEDEESFSREQYKEREKEANQFAAAFLLPEMQFSKDISFYPAKLDYYIQLKKKWKVSIAAMMHRACTLNIITPNQYQYLIKIYQANCYRKNEPLDDVLKTVRPSLLKDAVTILIENNYFTADEFINELANYGLPMNHKVVELLLNLDPDFLKPAEKEYNKIVSLKK